jgi:hypothetical protein
LIFNYLYKFQSLSVNSLSALATNKVWFSNQSALNDPFEGIVKLVEPSSKDELISKSIDYMVNLLEQEKKLNREDAKEITLQRYMEAPDEFIEFVSNAVRRENETALSYSKSVGVFSTAADIPNDERSHVSNMLLWSHYGRIMVMVFEAFV